MKLTMLEVIQVPLVFEKLRAQALPLRVAYTLNKIADAIDKETRFYYAELKKIFDKYGAVDEHGEPIFSDPEHRMRKIKEEFREETQRELNELTSLEVDFDSKLVIPLSGLENVNISIDELRPLVPFISD